MPLTINGKAMISTAEANQISGLSQTYICLSIRRGKIAGCKVGNTWMVERESLEQFLSQPRKPGPKPKATRAVNDSSMPEVAGTQA